jgi:hypothetical protein
MMRKGQEKPKKLFWEHDAAWFQSCFTQKQVFGKITHGHLKFLSRRVFQGFQRKCHNAKGSEKPKNSFWNMARLDFKVVSLKIRFLGKSLIAT